MSALANRQFAELLARRDLKSIGGPDVGNGDIRKPKRDPLEPLRGHIGAALRAKRPSSSSGSTSALASALKIQRAWRTILAQQKAVHHRRKLEQAAAIKAAAAAAAAAEAAAEAARKAARKEWLEQQAKDGKEARRRQAEQREAARREAAQREAADRALGLERERVQSAARAIARAMGEWTQRTIVARSAEEVAAAAAALRARQAELDRAAVCTQLRKRCEERAATVITNVVSERLDRRRREQAARAALGRAYRQMHSRHELRTARATLRRRLASWGYQRAAANANAKAAKAAAAEAAATAAKAAALLASRARAATLIAAWERRRVSLRRWRRVRRAVCTIQSVFGWRQVRRGAAAMLIKASRVALARRGRRRAALTLQMVWRAAVGRRKLRRRRASAHATISNAFRRLAALRAARRELGDCAGRPEPSIHTYIHAYIHTCIHTYMHTYMHACIHAYIHAYIHTYIHTLTESGTPT